MTIMLLSLCPQKIRAKMRRKLWPRNWRLRLLEGLQESFPHCLDLPLFSSPFCHRAQTQLWNVPEMHYLDPVSKNHSEQLKFFLDPTRSNIPFSAVVYCSTRSQSDTHSEFLHGACLWFSWLSMYLVQLSWTWMQQLTVTLRFLLSLLLMFRQ